MRGGSDSGGGGAEGYFDEIAFRKGERNVDMLLDI